ncbi:lytic murein transglycosylase [Streptomyces sp. NPDC090306]|uniref:lytic transglycosylase domain-containing protein n=1 Tax=Streptomyces sp. NPDC090306 TaxID=3365961 RepID=UPI0037F64E7F
MAAQFGRRLYKGAATATVAAAVVAALSASQAPGVTADSQGRQTTSGAPSADAGTGTGSADGGSAGDQGYYTDLPPLDSPNPSASPSATTGPATGDAESGIPATVLDAYRKAAAELQASKPGCNLPWQLLAAIGKVESGQAWGGQVDADGTTTKKIVGPELSGGAYAKISDTDNGVYDGDSAYDHAVGPMQFIPSTWAWAGRDGNGDGVKDPNNVYDAALAAGHYLCRNGWDLSTQADVDSAVLSYNNSTAYLNTVMSWFEYYRKGTHSIPNGTGSLPVHRSGDPTTPAEPEKPPVKSPPATTPPATSEPSQPTTPPSGGATTPPPTTPPATTPPTATETVARLVDADAGTLTATAGDAFTRKIAARAETSADKAVAKVRVRFTISGDTDATFTGGETVATVVTDSTGTAVAPALQAGETTGDFTVKAALVGRTVDAPSWTATVTARAADTLARTTDTALTCVADGEFADAVTLKATYKDAVADKVAATATLITSADDATVNDKGPYFKDADGNAVRTLTDLTTDADGLLKLPQLYADGNAGTYLLRVTTTGGATLTVELTMTAAPSDGTSTDSPSPEPSPTTDAS